MARNITVTFEDGSTHVYENAPDAVTPEAAIQRAQQDFKKGVAHIDGGRAQVSVPKAPKEEKSRIEQALDSGLMAITKPVVEALGDKNMNRVRGVALNAAAPSVGAAQLAANVTGVGKDAVNSAITKKSAEYEKERANVGRDGFDGAAVTGAIMSPANLFPARWISKAGTFANGLGRSIGAGAGMGLLQPVEEPDNYVMEKAKQVGTGAAVGAALPVAGAAVKATARALGATSPVQAAAKIVRESLQKTPDEVLKALRTARTPLPGSPTSAAEAAGDIGLARLQNTVLTKNPTEAANALAQDFAKNTARSEALEGIAKFPADLAAAKTARSAAVEPLYAKAYGETVKFTPELESLLSRPSTKSALNRARKLAAEEGVDIADNSVGMLHYVKKALDDMIDSAPLKGMGPTQKRALVNTQKQLLEQIDANSPTYKAARSKFQELSKPINQMETLQDVLTRAQTGSVDDVGNAIISGPKLNNILRTEGAELKKVLTEEQMQTLRNVKSDLDASSLVKRSGAAAVGSNTAANQNAVKAIEKLSGGSKSPVPFIGNTLDWIAAGKSDKTMKTLVEALRDPQKTADLIEKAQRGDAQALKLARALRFLSVGSSGVATGAVTQKP